MIAFSSTSTVKGNRPPTLPVNEAAANCDGQLIPRQCSRRSPELSANQSANPPERERGPDFLLGCLSLVGHQESSSPFACCRSCRCSQHWISPPDKVLLHRDCGRG